MIEPKILKGFRDFLPEDEFKRQEALHKLSQVFLSYAFLPIDTPVLEYAEVLLGKGGGETDKQVYHFQDQGGREVALRFDLTVPLARYVSQHWNDLSFPFKRFHMAKVWRGENPQKGRYREFMQCDFDILGGDALVGDIQTLFMVVDSLRKLEAPEFVVSFSHRALMKELLEKLGCSSHEVIILRSLDKISKIGREKVVHLLKEDGVPLSAINTLIDFVSLESTSISESIDLLEEKWGDFACLAHLRKIGEMIKDLGKENFFKLDFSIMRGLDYYTGLIFETTLKDFPQLGSVCSGGRYDNLLGLYSKNVLSGIGGSIGLDRLLNALGSRDKKPLDAVIAYLEEEDLVVYLKLADELRERGFNIDIYPQSKKINQQFDYAQKKGAFALIFIGKEEQDQDLISWKDLESKENFDKKPIDQFINYLKVLRS